MVKHYKIGAEVVLIAHFLNRNKVAFSPAAVTGAVKPPGAAPVVVVFTATGVLGEYEATYAPTVAGKHWWECNGVGAVDASAQRFFIVDEEKVV